MSAERARWTPEDQRHLSQALASAAMAAPWASPNPTVAALVVRDGEVIASGVHVYERRDHAEVRALASAGERARGATLYVTLEPCSTQGRTPPCVGAILDAGIARVVACSADPFPGHQGRGFAALRAAGVEVVTGVLRHQAVRVNAAFFASVERCRPHVTIKAATSIDGRIAAATGESRWLTGEAARERAHDLRRAADAVLVGAGTAAADDPRLSARPFKRAGRPLRCVLDPSLRLRPEARLLDPPEEREGAGPVLVFAAVGACAREPSQAEGLRRRGATIVELPSGESGFDLRHVLAALHERGARSLLVEGGGRTSGRFLAAGLVDRIVVHVAPLVLGSEGTPAIADFSARTLGDAVRLRRMSAEVVGYDVLLDAEVVGGFDAAELAARLAEMEG